MPLEKIHLQKPAAPVEPRPGTPPPGPGKLEVYEPDAFEKFATSPKFLDAVKTARNALTGAGTGNMLMALALGGALHPIGIGIGIAVGIGLRYLQKKGYLKPLGKLLDKAAEKLHLKGYGKLSARGKRLTGNILDWAGDTTFAAESASALYKPFSHFAGGVNFFLYPLNVLAKMIDLPIDVKNYEDVAGNHDANVDPETRKQDLRAEFAHMACGFLETAGAFIPPVDPVTIGLNVTLQAIGFAANRWRDSRDFLRKWLQGYDSGSSDSR